ncbi:MAG: aquaporin, partial [Caldilineaceae bacterium]|nr:aquaporin [Caldilineaceae bacterium]
SFANPAVTVARAFTNTFAGIRPGDIFYFIVAQLLGAFCALWICLWLLDDVSIKEELSSTPAET